MQMTAPTQSAQPIPSRFQIWWLTIRPATLWAGGAPVFLGTAIAYIENQHQLHLAVIALICAIFIQIACNLVNDYADFQKGADREDRLGPARAAAQGWLSVSDLKKGAITCLGIAFLLGIYLSYHGGIGILILGISSLIAAVAYTAGPFPLAYLGLGDLFVMLFFGLGAVGGTYYLQAQKLSILSLSAGFAVGALATAILVVNHLRDRISDEKSNKKTLAVRFGAKWTRIEYTALVAIAFLFCTLTFLQMKTTMRFAFLAPLILLPRAVVLVRLVWLNDGVALNPLLAQTAKLEMLYCLILSVSLALMKGISP
jgi:1,4-dihydroxy-2-naphthoate octaprenyltransferase